MFFLPFEQVTVLVSVLFRKSCVAEAQLKLFFEFLYLRVQEALLSKPNKLTKHTSFESISVPDASACAVQTIFRFLKRLLQSFRAGGIFLGPRSSPRFVRAQRKVSVIFPSLNVGLLVYHNSELSASPEPTYGEILFCLLLSWFTELIPQPFFKVVLQGIRSVARLFSSSPTLSRSL